MFENSYNHNCNQSACADVNEASELADIDDDIDDDEISSQDGTTKENYIIDEVVENRKEDNKRHGADVDEEDHEMGRSKRKVSTSGQSPDRIAEVAKIVMQFRQQMQCYNNEEKKQFILRYGNRTATSLSSPTVNCLQSFNCCFFSLFFFHAFIREINRQIAAKKSRGKCWLLPYLGQGILVCRQAWLTCLGLTSFAVDVIKKSSSRGTLS